MHRRPARLSMNTSQTSEELRAQLAIAVGDGYRLDAELPAGGMSRLFLATERSLDRRVVIKLLPPEYTSDIAAARFEREMTLTAHLQHPHIVPILAAGSSNGLLYCITPYVAGESLRRRLQSSGKLPVAAAIQILREVADALARAHEAGVVHRDIKPENILMQGEHALLADFGVAHVLRPASNGERLTATGMSLGTIGYMAPEQLVGDANIDGRADVYALGVVGYELLAGEPPFVGKSAQALVGAHLTHVPQPLSERLPDVPPAVSAAISRALAKDPDERFATAGAFRDALAITGATTARLVQRRLPFKRPSRWALGAAAVVVLAAGAAITWRAVSSRSTVATAFAPIRIAVLPFDNVGDSANAYFAEGVADAVRDKLVAIPGLQVIASTSSAEYRNTKKPVQQIASELNVQYVLTGNVRWERDADAARSRVIVHPALIDPATSSQQWGEQFDSPLTDVFRVQGDIARKVAEKLRVALTAESRRTLVQRPTIDLDAYDAYLRARALERTAYSPTTYRRVVTAYREAVRRDSTFAVAWAALGRAHIRSYVVASPPPPNEGDSARVAGERALRLSPRLADGHVVLAQYYTYVTKERPKALRELGLALEVSPTDASLLAQIGNTEVRAGQWDAGVAHLEKALQLDPRDAVTATDLGTDYLRLRRYDAARRTLDRALALEPSSLVAIKQRAMVQLAQGDLTGARLIVRAAGAAVDSSALLAYLTSVHPLTWMLDSAQQRLLLSLTPESFEGMRDEWGRAKGLVYTSRGDVTRGLAYLDSARAYVEADLAATPNDPNPVLLAIRSVLLAHAGRRAEAVFDGERAAKLISVDDDAILGPWVRHMLTLTYVATGDTDQAIDLLGSLLRIPYYLSPAWLRIDPNFAPLRGSPRFEALLTRPVA